MYGLCTCVCLLWSSLHDTLGLENSCLPNPVHLFYVVDMHLEHLLEISWLKDLEEAKNQHTIQILPWRYSRCAHSWASSTRDFADYALVILSCCAKCFGHLGGVLRWNFVALMSITFMFFLVGLRLLVVFLFDLLCLVDLFMSIVEVM